MQPFGPGWWDAMITDPSLKSDPLKRDDPTRERLVGHRPHPDLSPRCLRFTNSMLQVIWDRQKEPGFFLAEWIQEDTYTSRPVQDRVCHHHMSIADVQRAYAAAVESGRGADFVENELPAILHRVSLCADKLRAGIESAKGILKSRAAADRSEQGSKLNAEKNDYENRRQQFVDSVLKEQAKIEGSKWPRATKDKKLMDNEKKHEKRAGAFLAERDSITLMINLFNWYTSDLEQMLKAIKEAEAELQADEDLLSIQVPQGHSNIEPVGETRLDQEKLAKDKEEYYA